MTSASACCIGGNIVKPIKIINATALLLLLGIVAPAYARQDKPPKEQEKARPAQQQQARPERQQQAQAPRQQRQQQQAQAPRQQRQQQQAQAPRQQRQQQARGQNSTSSRLDFPGLPDAHSRN